MQCNLTMDSERCLYTVGVSPHCGGETEAQTTLEPEWLRFESLPLLPHLNPHSKNRNVSSACLIRGSENKMNGGENRTCVGSPGEVCGDVGKGMTLLLSGSLALPRFFRKWKADCPLWSCHSSVSSRPAKVFPSPWVSPWALASPLSELLPQ